MNNLVDAILFTLAIITPFVVLVAFAATSIALAYFIFLLVAYQIERRSLDCYKDKRLLKEIRSGKI